MIFAHISDLHINTEIVNSHLRQTEALINSALEQGAEHFIITGDVSDKALAEDFRRLRELLKKYKLLDPQKLSMVVGNHDIFGGVSHAEDIFTFPEKCRTTDYSQGIYSFNNYFEEAFAECIYRSGDGSGYPFAKRIGQCLLIGLNSIQEYSSIKNPFASNGKICDRQKEELKKILMYFGDTVKYRILMVHHHFNKIKSNAVGLTETLWQNIEKQTMKLKNKSELIELLKAGNIDLVVHGHLHESGEYTRKDMRFLNAGASIKGNMKGFLSLNLINASHSSLETDTQLFEVAYHPLKRISPLPRVSNIIVGSREKIPAIAEAD